LERYVIKLEELGMTDVESVGGKNASLGEMIHNLSSLGVTVPGGFATTAAAYREFLSADGLDQKINDLLADLDVDNIEALTSAGKSIRQWIMETPLPDEMMRAVREARHSLVNRRRSSTCGASTT
jgi:pyruvate,water dikinase